MDIYSNDNSNNSEYDNNSASICNILDFNYLNWQCKRGMLELDQILLKFLQDNYSNWSNNQKKEFYDLLMHNDADLFDWLLGKNLPVEFSIKNLILLIRKNN